MSENIQDDLSQLASLKNALLFNELTTFAQLGNYGLFVPKAAVFSSTFLKWRPHQIIDPRGFMLRRDTDKLMDEWKPSNDPSIKNSDCRVYLKIIFDALVKKKLSFGLLDVGGYLGIYSVLAGLLANNMKIKMPIKCYEPGPTDHLIEANLSINKIRDYEVRRFAISDVDGPLLYKYSAGKSIIGGIHRMKNEFARVVYSTTLEKELTGSFKNLDCAIAKIDVEGFEPEALMGMGNKAKKIPIIICEVQPWAREKMIGNREYAKVLDQDYYIVEIGNSIWPHAYEGVKKGKLDEYLDKVKTRQPPVSDMIMLRKDFPLSKALYKKLCAVDPMDRTGIE